jgi:hypothetical protein
MKLLTAEQERRMRENGAVNAELSLRGKRPNDFMPVVKLFCPWGGATWLSPNSIPRTPTLPSDFVISAWVFPN